MKNWRIKYGVNMYKYEPSESVHINTVPVNSYVKSILALLRVIHEPKEH